MTDPNPHIPDNGHPIRTTQNNTFTINHYWELVTGRPWWMWAVWHADRTPRIMHADWWTGVHNAYLRHAFTGSRSIKTTA